MQKIEYEGVNHTNRKPVDYMQTDARWAKLSYAVPGESSTIGSAGCGPTCAAMAISAITGKTFTPADACQWSVSHGYKALNQGTYYSYFKAQMRAFGIDCQQLNYDSVYCQPLTYAELHDSAQQMVKRGYWLIALMKKGLWTGGGHFVLVWEWDTKVRILDPNSKAQNRLNGDPNLFRKEVAYYWAIDARQFNAGGEEVTKEEFKSMHDVVSAEAKLDQTVHAYSADARLWAVGKGLVTGDTSSGTPNYMWQGPLTREDFVTFMYRYHQMMASESGLRKPK